MLQFRLLKVERRQSRPSESEPACRKECFFAEYPPRTAGESGRETVGAKANILKSEIMGEGRRSGNRFGGQAGNRSERKGGKAGSFPSFYEKMALLSLGGDPFGAGLAETAPSPPCSSSQLPSCPLLAILHWVPRVPSNREIAPSPHCSKSFRGSLLPIIQRTTQMKRSRLLCPHTGPSPACPFSFLLPPPSVAPRWDLMHPTACSSLNDLYLSQPLCFFFFTAMSYLLKKHLEGLFSPLLTLPQCLVWCWPYTKSSVIARRINQVTKTVEGVLDNPPVWSALS